MRFSCSGVLVATDYLRFPLFLLYALLNLQIAAGQDGKSWVEIKLASGKTMQASVAEVGSSGIKVLQADQSEISLGYPEISEILIADAIALPSQPSLPCKVELIDGSYLNASDVLINEGMTEFTIVGENRIRLESGHLSTIMFREEGPAPGIENDWKSEVGLESFSADAVIVNRDGKLQGAEGVLEKVTPENVEFVIGDRSATVSVDRIFAIAFYRTERIDAANCCCQLQLVDGSQINVREWNIGPSQIRVVTTSDAEITFPLFTVRKINFGMGRELFLDVAGPATNQWEPLIASPATVAALRKLKTARKNRSFSNRPLELDMSSQAQGVAPLKTFEHGFAIQGGGRLSFVLNDDYRILSGLVGFDPRASDQGAVRLTIRVDDRIAFEQIMEKRKIKQPLEIAIDIANADRLVFLVDYHDGRSVGDQIHLVNLKVTK